MKILNIFISLIFIFVIAFCMVGCDKNNTENNKNNENNLAPPNIEKVLTTNEVLYKVYEKINTNLNLDVEYFETSKINKSFASGDGSSFYNDFIFAGLSILNELSTYAEFETDTVYSSAEFTDINENGHSKKIEKFYIINNKKQTNNNIKIYILCPRADYSINKLDSIILYYDIFYNEKTDECILSCKIEKSNALSNSDAFYYSFDYVFKDNIFDFNARYFYRTTEFDINDDNLLVENINANIKDFRCIYFDIVDNIKYYPITEKDYSLTNPEIRDKIVDDLKEFSTYREFLDNKTVEIENSSIFKEKLLTIINATKISDFATV